MGVAVSKIPGKASSF